MEEYADQVLKFCFLKTFFYFKRSSGKDEILSCRGSLKGLPFGSKAGVQISISESEICVVGGKKLGNFILIV